MELEKEIQQSKFHSDVQKMIVNLLYTASWVSHQHSELLKPYGLTIQQYNVLRILRGQHPNPATVHLIQERMLDKMSNASRLVEKLRQKGYVERRQCPNDRRAVDILITPQGLALLEKLDVAMKTWEANFTTLDTSEIKTLNQLLDKLRG
jgi:DNA-binding MarR family transcriptional regulator